MSSIEMVVFGALWAIAFVMGALLLLLYRQVEKAYRQDLQEQSGGLLPGVEAPPLEVLNDEGNVPLQLPYPGELALVAFMTTTCDACTKLLPILADDRVTDARVLTLMSGGRAADVEIPDNPRVEVLWLAHPPDATRRYGASIAPFVYVLRGRTVLASKTVSTREGVADLREDARANEERLHDESAREPVEDAVPA